MGAWAAGKATMESTDKTIAGLHEGTIGSSRPFLASSDRPMIPGAMLLVRVLRAFPAAGTKDRRAAAGGGVARCVATTADDRASQSWACGQIANVPLVVPSSSGSGTGRAGIRDEPRERLERRLWFRCA